MGLPYKFRKIISRVRCSNHPLAIEKGRYTNPKTPREERICILCTERAIEDEVHFLVNCPVYTNLKDYYQINANLCVPDLLNMDDQYTLGKYLLSAFELRERLLCGRGRE